MPETCDKCGPSTLAVWRFTFPTPQGGQRCLTFCEHCSREMSGMIAFSVVSHVEDAQPVLA